MDSSNTNWTSSSLAHSRRCWMNREPSWSFATLTIWPVAHQVTLVNYCRKLRVLSYLKTKLTLHWDQSPTIVTGCCRSHNIVFLLRLFLGGSSPDAAMAQRSNGSDRTSTRHERTPTRVMTIALIIVYLMVRVHNNILFMVRKWLGISGCKIPIMLRVVGRGVSYCWHLPKWADVLHLILKVYGIMTVLGIELLRPIRMVWNIYTVLTDKLHNTTVHKRMTRMMRKERIAL